MTPVSGNYVFIKDEQARRRVSCERPMHCPLWFVVVVAAYDGTAAVSNGYSVIIMMIAVGRGGGDDTIYFIRRAPNALGGATGCPSGPAAFRLRATGVHATNRKTRFPVTMLVCFRSLFRLRGRANRNFKNSRFERDGSYLLRCFPNKFETKCERPK